MEEVPEKHRLVKIFSERNVNMKILTIDEISVWLKGQSLFIADKAVFWEKFLKYHSFSTPKDSGIKTALSKNIIPMLLSSPECLIWIREYGVWPSNQNMALFEMLRNSLGETRPLSQAPGHLCTGKDMQLCESLLDLILYFYWGALIVGSKGEYAINISHNEIIEVGGTEEFIRGIKDVLPE